MLIRIGDELFDDKNIKHIRKDKDFEYVGVGKAPNDVGSMEVEWYEKVDGQSKHSFLGPTINDIYYPIKIVKDNEKDWEDAPKYIPDVG